MRDLEALRDFIEGDAQLASLLRRVEAELVDDPAHDLAHALRVALWTLRLGGETIDARAGIAAALLHDFVHVPKSSPERALASERSADEARRLLPAYGFGAAAIEAITEAIREHSYSRGGRPEGALGKALQDADRLEALGALGIFRVIATGVQMGSAFFATSDPWAEARELDDRAFTIDHFFTKLLKLARTMNTERGRREAELRIARMRSYLEDLGDEIGRPLPSARIASLFEA